MSLFSDSSYIQNSICIIDRNERNRYIYFAFKHWELFVCTYIRNYKKRTVVSTSVCVRYTYICLYWTLWPKCVMEWFGLPKLNTVICSWALQQCWYGCNTGITHTCIVHGGSLCWSWPHAILPQLCCGEIAVSSSVHACASDCSVRCVTRDSSRLRLAKFFYVVWRTWTLKSQSIWCLAWEMPLCGVFRTTEDFWIMNQSSRWFASISTYLACFVTITSRADFGMQW